MPYVSKGDLENYFASISSEKKEQANRNLMFKAAGVKRVVFLSHSHHDRDIVEKVRLFLATLDTDVYVDWKDLSMPRITDSSTAQRIRDRIVECNKFIMLASNEALDSKWVPWELGYADSSKSLQNIAVLPLVERYEEWKGSEYISIYPHIKKDIINRYVVSGADSSEDRTLGLWLRY